METLDLLRSGVQQVALVANDAEKVPLRSWRAGEQITVDFLSSLAAEGRIFVAQAGTLDTPLTTPTAYDATKPGLAIENSDEQIIIPIGFEFTAVATAAITHVHIAMTPVKVLSSSAGVYTALAEGTGVLNCRSGCSRKSGTRAASLVTTTAGDYTTGAVYLDHRGNQGDLDGIAVDPTYQWSAMDDLGFLPMCEGGSLVAFFFNSSGTHFAKFFFATLPKNDYRLKL